MESLTVTNKTAPNAYGPSEMLGIKQVLSGGSDGKEVACNVGNPGSIPG